MAGPVTWNCLPLDICSAPALSTFKTCSRRIFSHVPTLLTVSRVRAANIVVTLAMLLRFINCRCIIIVLSDLTQSSNMSLSHCHQPVWCAHSGSVLPRGIHKTLRMESELLASTHSCRKGCIRSITTLYHIKHARWSNANEHCYWDQASNAFVTFPSELDRI